MKGFKFAFKRICSLGILSALFVSSISAQQLIDKEINESQQDGDPFVPPSAFTYNYGEMNNVQTDVTTLTTALMGDSIDPNTGTVSFTHTDISIPGNFDIPVALQRTMSDPDNWYKESLEVGNWSLAIPHVRGSYIRPIAGIPVSQVGDNSPWLMGMACSKTHRPSFSKVIGKVFGDKRLYTTGSHDYSNIRTISIPGKGSAQITIKNGVLTNSKNWKVDCLNKGSRNEGFLVTTTDGTKYKFRHKREIKSRKHHYLTKEEWRCGSDRNAYCEFPLHAPNDEAVTAFEALRRNQNAKMDNIHAFLQVTEIEDRYGNKVNYSYDSNGDLDKITSTDGREIDLTFTSGRLTSAEANGRTWIYEYERDSDLSLHMLAKVIQPDQLNWEFDYGKPGSLRFWSLLGLHTQTNPLMPYSCSSLGFGSFITITHPSKVSGEFVLSERCMGKAEIPKVENFNPFGQGKAFQSYVLPIHVQLFALHSKTLTFADGKEYTWSYKYSTNKGYFLGDNPLITERNKLSNFTNPSGPFIPLETKDKPEHMNATFITHPDGAVEVKYYDRRYGFTDGQLRYSAIFDENENIKMSKRYDYHEVTHCTTRPAIRKYGFSSQLTSPVQKSWVKSTPCPGWERFEQAHGAVQNQNIAAVSTIYYDGNSNSTYSETIDGYNDYDVPTRFSQKSDVAERYIGKTFIHDTNQWLLNQPSKVYVSDSEMNSATDGTLLSEIKYYSNSHASYPSMPYQEHWLGELRKTFKSYHMSNIGKNGKLKKVEMNVGMYSNKHVKRWVLFSDYKRGHATNVFVPQRYTAHNMHLSKIVDDNGWITRTTDFNGTHTHYGYDEMGNIAYIDYENDASADENWSDLRFTWISEDEPKRIVEHCELNAERTACSSLKMRTTENYDGFYRLVKSKSDDLVTNSNSRYQRFEYNFRNQTTFSSRPSINSSETKGTTVNFDALGRMASTKSTGFNTVYEEYLGNNTKRVTDGNGNQTTTQYLAYDRPSYQNALTITSPESVTTEMDYNLWGNIETITQSGLGKANQAVTQTEYRSYDANNNLCLIVRSDVGATALNHNSMGELIWQAQGVAYNPKTRACISKPNNLAVTMTYDNLGDLYSATYPTSNATPDVVHLRDNNGNLTMLTAGNIVQTYRYNNQNLLTRETVRIPGKSVYQFEHGYSAQKFPESITYPGGMKVSYAPNGFGQATTAEIPPVSGSLPYKFAHDVKYYANGQMRSFTYGNGIRHTQGQHSSSALPSSLKYANGGNAIVELAYSYDDNTNVTAIVDKVNSAYSLTNLRYDGLDRLIQTTGGSGIGSSVMRYDSFGNITYYKSKDRINHYNYSYNSNRLTAVASSGIKQKDYTSFSYDNRGNVTHNSHQEMEYNLANQMTSAKGSNSYLYDGFNRRVKQTDAKGTSYSVYSQSGTLLLRETNKGKISYIYLGGKLISKIGKSESPSSSSQHYAPFGSVIEGEKDAVGYTGHKFDTDVGLSYMQARYYDPVIGRFYSNDPVGFTGDITTFNRYSYVGNNPYIYIDPDGRSRKHSSKMTGASINFIISGYIMENSTPGSAVHTHASRVNAIALDQLTDGAVKNRVKIRKGTLKKIKDKQPRDSDGNMIDPNTKKPLKPGQVDIGHKPGNEWKKRKKMHKKKANTREEVIEEENDPDLYQLEDRSTNRSHKYEEKDK
ncbi:hypothetical protein ISG33_16480 [Glaciecola sp. MH2013]|uniref:RHS repeat-associated core domain-containing protein n=1 Tax=Glaciecola sp. MH2013 TaxID=2785524 RepID=UPI0018A0141E|nr:RHS repeat-associated core domain-containing protein [Glaciecola sp. MH2013]MBF7074999.1 hypothetical protein [Glaciecola sp. MH2013]